MEVIRRLKGNAMSLFRSCLQGLTSRLHVGLDCTLAAFKRKDQEFDALMDVKIALALEIKKYRDLLEKEEQRLGTTPDKRASKKKRKLDEGSSASDEKEPAPVQDDDNSSLVFSGMDLHGAYLTVKNSSTVQIPLAGWCIKTQAHGFEYYLPEDISLKPGRILVRCGHDCVACSALVSTLAVRASPRMSSIS